MKGKIDLHARRRTLLAWGAAVILVIAGMGFRVLAAGLSRVGPSTASTLPHLRLDELPLQLGSWQGEDIPLDDRLAAATDADAIINRNYIRPGGDAVGLYIAFGRRPRDMAPHRPEVCYPGAGWAFMSEEPASLKSAFGGGELPGRVLEFSRGGLDGRTMVVLNYFVVDGNYGRDIESLRSRSWNVNYVAQVQIACPTNIWRDTAAARRVILDFAAAAVGPLHKVLTEEHPATTPEEAA